ncbi:Ionotropic glutamate receptor L-glutamate and glycine-binding domain [Trinorchestia longiramus]|nr:Ionotropic glutamate receptor L-glutamate and glycine-binding domain [Trinorchestia longiramus]
MNVFPSQFPELPWLVLGRSFPASVLDMRLPINNQVVFAIFKEYLSLRMAFMLTDTAEDLPDRARRVAYASQRDAKVGVTFAARTGNRESAGNDAEIVDRIKQNRNEELRRKEVDEKYLKAFEKKDGRVRHKVRKLGNIGAEINTEAERGEAGKLRRSKADSSSGIAQVTGARRQANKLSSCKPDGCDTRRGTGNKVGGPGSVQKVTSGALTAVSSMQKVVTYHAAAGSEYAAKLGIESDLASVAESEAESWIESRELRERKISDAAADASGIEGNGVEVTVELWESYTVTKDTPVAEHKLLQWTPSSPIPQMISNLAKRRMDLLGARLACVTEQQAPGVRIEEASGGELLIFGWIIDLVDALQRTMNFTSPDREFGTLSQDGAWTGMVGEVTEGRADLIVASLDNTLARSKVVDFLISIDVTGYIMVMRPTAQLGSAWTNYTSEFSVGVWKCLAVVLCVGCVVLYVTRSYSPSERNRSTSFAEACTTVIAAITSQSYVCKSTASSGRTALITLLLTAVLVTAHYNSWLYSTLSFYVPGYPFDGFHSLLDQKSYTLGIIKGVSVETELKDSKDSTIQRVWTELVNPQGLVSSSQEGLQKAREEGFVFLIIESEFYGSDITPCDFTVLPRNFFKFPSGFAVKKGSPLGPIFNRALIQMLNTGILRRMRGKWYQQKSDCISHSLASITPRQTISAFCLLASGCAVALLVCSGEILLKWKSFTASTSRRNE